MNIKKRASACSSSGWGPRDTACWKFSGAGIRTGRWRLRGACASASFTKSTAGCATGPMLLRCALGAAVITGMELLVGLLVNERWHMNVWDYSRRRFNYRGQICALYSMLWFLLCIPLGPFCAWLRRRVAR